MELLIEFIFELFGNLIFESIIYGFQIIFKKPKEKLLHKKFILLKTINPKIRKGMRGIVLKVIDSKNIYVGFRNKYGKKIMYQRKSIFKILTINTSMASC